MKLYDRRQDEISTSGSSTVTDRPTSAIYAAINARARWPVSYSRRSWTSMRGEEISKAERQRLGPPATIKG
jgi:hypothetical protein